MPHKIRLVDEDPEQRSMYASLLNTLFYGADVSIEPMSPLREKEDYVDLLASGGLDGLILDQRLGDGGFNYSGSDLATFIRSIDSKLPIFILTNFKSDREQFAGSEKDVEYICAKGEITDPRAESAQIVKARFLRRLNVFADVRSERQARYHELLVKSLESTLSEEEVRELGLLKEQRLLPIQAAELKEAPHLDSILENLRKFVGEK